MSKGGMSSAVDPLPVVSVVSQCSTGVHVELPRGAAPCSLSYPVSSLGMQVFQLHH